MSSQKHKVVLVGLLTVAGALVVPEARADWDPNPFGASVVEQHHLCSEEDLPEADDQIQGDVPKADQGGRARQGYNCGLSLVGHTAIRESLPDDDGDGIAAPNPDPDAVRTSNANMAWAGDCAYVSGSAVLFGDPRNGGLSDGGPVFPGQEAPAGHGVAVIDASDPTDPEHVATLRSPGALWSSETLHAVETRDRAILVVGEYGNVGKSAVPMDIYDVSDCAHPVLLESYLWPENIHNLTISGNGRYVFATQPLQVLDLEPLFDGRADDDPSTIDSIFVGNLEDDIPVPLVPTGPGADLDDQIPDELRAVREARTQSNLLGDDSGITVSTQSHEAWPSEDGTRLHIGGVTAQSEALSIVDLTEWLQGGDAHLLGQRTGRAHSIRTATMADQYGRDRHYIIHSEEAVFGTAYGCAPETANPFAGPAQPYITEFDAETGALGPTLNQFGLEINQPEHCPDQLDSGVNSSTHYHTVDDPEDTHFVMASMWNSGLRVFDVRNPDRPTEVAYFNPADVGKDGVLLDQAWGHSRYVPETGQIWFATAAGGFWIVELAPQVIDALDLTVGRSSASAEKGNKGKRPPVAGGPGASAAPEGHRPHHPKGRPATTGIDRIDVPAAPAAAPVYCTLAPALPAAVLSPPAPAETP